MRIVRGEVVATDDQIARATVGNSSHRIWSGGCSDALRKKHAPECDVIDFNGCNVVGHPAWEKALVARPSLPKRGVSPTETLHWHVKPRDLPVHGAKCSDGSVREGAI